MLRTRCVPGITPARPDTQATAPTTQTDPAAKTPDTPNRHTRPHRPATHPPAPTHRPHRTGRPTAHRNAGKGIGGTPWGAWPAARPPTPPTAQCGRTTHPSGHSPADANRAPRADATASCRGSPGDGFSRCSSPPSTLSAPTPLGLLTPPNEAETLYARANARIHTRVWMGTRPILNPME